MDERLVARLCSGLGFSALGLIAFLEAGWTEAGSTERTACATALAMAVTGLALDIKHRRQRATDNEAT